MTNTNDGRTPNMDPELEVEDEATAEERAREERKEYVEGFANGIAAKASSMQGGLVSDSMGADTANVIAAWGDENAMHFVLELPDGTMASANAYVYIGAMSSYALDGYVTARATAGGHELAEANGYYTRGGSLYMCKNCGASTYIDGNSVVGMLHLHSCVDIRRKLSK